MRGPILFNGVFEPKGHFMQEGESSYMGNRGLLPLRTVRCG